MTSSSPTRYKCVHEESTQLIVFTPSFSSDCPTINFSNMSNIWFIVRLFNVILMERNFFAVIVSHEYRCVCCCLVLHLSSFRDWSNIFRNRSFTVCKSGLDSNDMSDSAAVSVSISSSSTINLSVCSCFRHFNWFPLLRRPLFVSIPLWVAWWVSVLYKIFPFLAVAQSTISEVVDFQIWFSVSFRMQQKQVYSDSLRCIERPNSWSASILMWLLSLPASFCLLFEITSRQLAELKWLMLKKFKDDSIHDVWHFLWLGCRQVGF